MGKKSRRKAPRDVKAKATPQALGIREAKPPTAQVPGRFPPPAHFGLEMGTAENLLRKLYVVEAVPRTVNGTGQQALVSFAPLAFKLFCAARHNAVLRRSNFCHF